MDPAHPDGARPGRSAAAASGSVPAATPRPVGPVGPGAGRSHPRPTDPSTWDRLSTLGPRVVDAGLLLGVGLLVLLDLFTTQQEGGPGRAALAKLALSVTALPAVALRRRWPVASMAAMVAVVLITSLGRQELGADGYGYWYPVFAPIAALGALATPVIRRQPVAVAIAAGVAGAVAVLSLTDVANDSTELILLVVLFGGTYVIGVGAGVYLRDLDRQRHLAAETARLDERMDLARELHDLVAHYVTGIVVQAQAARVVADRDPAAAGEALDRIEGAGKDALGAMRRLVGSLRDDDGAPVAPPVGLAGLDDLVGTSGTLGLAVELTIDDDAHHRLPGAVAASTHRIVQEALTNVRRHAVDAGRARVDVRVDGGTLVVTVDDDGRQPVGGHRTDPRRGYGLVGMQERAQALGGTLTAGPLDPPAHGWRVQARLPLDEPDLRRPR